MITLFNGCLATLGFLNTVPRFLKALGLCALCSPHTKLPSPLFLNVGVLVADVSRTTRTRQVRVFDVPVCSPVADAEWSELVQGLGENKSFESQGTELTEVACSPFAFVLSRKLQNLKIAFCEAASSGWKQVGLLMQFYGNCCSGYCFIFTA